MTTAQLLSQLRGLDVTLWIDGDRLRYSAPDGVVTDSLKAELVKHKKDVLAFLQEAQTATVDKVPPLTPAARDGKLPLSYPQHRLWLLCKLAPESPFYNICYAVRILGCLDVFALRQTFAHIVRRHEVLRTTFPVIDGEPFQSISPTHTCPMPLVDLQDVSDCASQDQARRLAAVEAQRPFDLARGPLLRTLLAQLGAEEHVLLITLHHIVADAWSMGLLAQEINSLYGTLAKGHSPSLADLPVQYADFAVWQRDWLQGDVLQHHLAYWKKQLAGCPAVLPLPTDRPRPAVQTFRGNAQSVVLPDAMAAALDQLCQEEDVTLFMVLLSAYQILLYRYSGQRDILVGTPIANRNCSETERLIGFFVNMLVMRSRFRDDVTFREALHHVRDAALEAYAHQDLPFEKLVDELQLERNPSYTPLFQVGFQLQTARQAALELPGLKLSPLSPGGATAKYDLALSMFRSAQSLSASLEFNTDLFDADTTARMLNHFQTLLDSAVANPELPISNLPLMPPLERTQLLVQWNDTGCDVPRGLCVHQLFEARTAHAPDAIAAAQGSEQLTYGQLNRRANQLARHLRALGVGPEARVAVCMQRSLDFAIAILGIIKAGGAYVPLDPAYPKKRLTFALNDCQAPVLLTHSSVIDSLGPHGAKTVCLDADRQLIAHHCGRNLDGDVSEGNLAYVIYTSGSTGTAKGVEIQHASLTNLVHWHHHLYSVRSDDRASQLASLAFDASVWEIWPYLTSGASVHFALADTCETASRLIDWLVDEVITISFLPTPLAEVVVDEPWPQRTPLRTLLTGGDKLHRGPRHTRPFDLVNHYGPTEYTVVTTCAPVACGAESDAAPPIGRPIGNTHVYLLDSVLEPVPVGFSGELHVGGAGLARGYQNRPDLTAERLVPDPHGHGTGVRLYRTGDFARYLPDGNIQFLGRNDQQVKIRGFRIELGEIEAALGQHPKLREAVVAPREDEPGNKRLVAYLVALHDSPPSDGELRGFLRDKLPEYMIPTAFVLLDSLPVSANGKVDRRKLPEPEPTGTERDAEATGPRTGEERFLVEIWSKVLGREHVGVRDNFFELGGDSIRLIQVVARANQAGIPLTPTQLFQHPTIESLALQCVKGAAQSIQAEQGVVTGNLPLTPIQHFFFEDTPPHPHHWNWAYLREVRQALRPDFLQRAVKHLWIHHDALRMRFPRKESGWEQVNADVDGTVSLIIVDLSAVGLPEQRRAIESAAGMLQTSLNLSDGPLVRVAYFDLGTEQSHRILVILHHLIVDGISLRVLMEDLQTAYQQLCRGQPIQLPPKTTSFRHWARKLTEYARSTRAEQGRDYWLTNVPHGIAPLPRDFSATLSQSRRHENAEESAGSLTVTLSEEETTALLQDVPAAYHTQINDVLLTALVQAFANWTGSNTLLVELEGHGREDLFDDVDLSRTVGWFTAMFPVLLQLGDASQPAEALKSVKEQLRRIPNRGIGYGVLRYLGVDQARKDKLLRAARAEVSFNYLGQYDDARSEPAMFTPARESAGPERSPLARRRHLIEVISNVAGGRLRVSWRYGRNVHEHSTIERLGEDFIEGLRGIIRHCQSPEAGGFTPSDFPLLNLKQQSLDKIVRKIKVKTAGSAAQNVP